jgi:hypothetical protein
MLQLYASIYHGNTVIRDESSQTQNHLELFGLVRVTQGQFEVRNEIYRKVFGMAWMRSLGIAGTGTTKAEASSTNRLPIWIVLGVVLLILVVGGGYLASAGGGQATPTTTIVVASETPLPTLTATTEPATEVIPTEPPTVIPTTEPPTATLLPTVLPTTAVLPTSMPEPTIPPPTPQPQAACVVFQQAFARAQPDSDAPIVGEIKVDQSPFVPLAKAGDEGFEWVRVPPELIGGATGWVYVGPIPDGTYLARCTDLQFVPQQ